MTARSAFFSALLVWLFTGVAGAAPVFVEFPIKGSSPGTTAGFICAGQSFASGLEFWIPDSSFSGVSRGAAPIVGLDVDCQKAAPPDGHWLGSPDTFHFMPVWKKGGLEHNNNLDVCPTNMYVDGFQVVTQDESEQPSGTLGPTLHWIYLKVLVPSCSNPLTGQSRVLPGHMPTFSCPHDSIVVGLAIHTDGHRLQNGGMYCAPFDIQSLCEANPKACSTFTPPPPSLCQSNPKACSAQPSAAAAPQINVREGTYGLNCGGRRGNVTDHIAAACNGKVDCMYTIDHNVIGDPVSGCRKDYIAQWQCGRNPALKTVMAPAEAGFGSKIFLSCR